MQPEFWLLILVGFLAQLIDGSLGMAYGVSATSFLLTFGISPAIASVSVHASEIVTTAVSGLSHYKVGNVDMNLVKRLAIPGILGGIAGAYLLTNISGDVIKPFVAIYLLVMGIRIIYKATKPSQEGKVFKNFPLVLLGFIGGSMDAIGGGGWGPIVTTTLISSGGTPRTSIGSVNLTEFFVTFATVLTFVATIGIAQWDVVLGLLIGGLIAAPFGALLTKKLPASKLMILVGLLIVFLQLRTLYYVFF